MQCKPDHRSSYFSFVQFYRELGKTNLSQFIFKIFSLELRKMGRKIYLIAPTTNTLDLTDFFYTENHGAIFVSGGRRVFREFLRCEYSEENILFWIACEDLKKETSPEKVEEKARMIYEDYVSILSPREVCCILRN